MIVVARTVGETITWLLDTWGTVLKIKDWYDQGKALNIPEEQLTAIEGNLKRTIEAAFETHTKQLIETYRPNDQNEPGRHHELANAITRSQRLLMTRIEQGMQIDIRYLPPPEPPEGQTGAERAQEEAIAAQIAVISRQLKFPKPTGEPLLQLVLQQDDETPVVGE